MELSMTNLERALEYSARGWAVLPVWNVDEVSGDCACGNTDGHSIGKHPIHPCVPHGVLDATTDSATIEGWWAEFPDANVAIATGESSGHLVVFDIDPRNGGSLEILESAFGDLSATHTVRTGGGGWHFYTQAAENVASKGNIVPGIDVKSDGGYVLAPPSNHAEGKYELLTASGAKLVPTPMERLGTLTGPPEQPQGPSRALPRTFDHHSAVSDPEKRAELFKAEPKAELAYNRTLLGLSDSSPSGHDMALANYAAGAGWSQEEIAALIAQARRVHGDKPNGRSYYASTSTQAIRAQEEREERAPEAIPDMVIEDIYTIAELDIPEREVIIDPWLKERQLGLCYAKRGVGKTYFCLSVACAVATGTPLFGWDIAKPRKVLYIDGEMDLSDLRMRIAGILAGRRTAIDRGMLHILRTCSRPFPPTSSWSSSTICPACSAGRKMTPRRGTRCKTCSCSSVIEGSR
jgi:hypothetical protein